MPSTQAIVCASMRDLFALAKFLVSVCAALRLESHRARFHNWPDNVLIIQRSSVAGAYSCPHSWASLPLPFFPFLPLPSSFLPFPFPSFPIPSRFLPSLPLSLEVAVGGLGERSSSHSGSGRSRTAKRFFGELQAENRACSSNGLEEVYKRYQYMIERKKRNMLHCTSTTT